MKIEQAPLSIVFPKPDQSHRVTHFLTSRVELHQAALLPKIRAFHVARIILEKVYIAHFVFCLLLIFEAPAKATCFLHASSIEYPIGELCFELPACIPSKALGLSWNYCQRFYVFGYG